MKILVLSPFMPCQNKHGGAAQIFNLWKAFSSLPDSYVKICTYQTEMEDGAEAQFETEFEDGIKIKTGCPDEWLLYPYLDASDERSSSFFLEAYNNELKALIASERFDAVVIEMQIMMHYAKYLKEISPSLPVILVVHESLGYRYRNDDHMLQDFNRYAQQFSSYVDLLITFSDEDKQRVSEFDIDTIVSPLCVNLSPLADVEQHDNVISFLGSYNHSPNQDSVNYILEEILPRITVPYEFHIYGSQLTPELTQKWGSCPNVVVVGYAETAEAVYRSAKVFVAPIVSGTGVRTKLVEAMNQGAAVVTTSLGMEGLAAVGGIDIFVEDDPVEMALKIEELLGAESRLEIDFERAVMQHRPDVVAETLLNKLKMAFL